MAKNIPQAGGLPGVSGPPNWFQAPPAGTFSLDDPNWFNSMKTAFGAGAAGSNYFRAIQAVSGGQQFIYLSFRAAFVPNLSDQYDTVFLGLQRKNGNKAIVIQIPVHAGVTPKGPPSANPPGTIANNQVQFWTRLNNAAAWSGPVTAPNTWWIESHVRTWLQTAADVAGDANNRWAVQLRIPANTVGDVDSDAGPNIGNDFFMWYYMRGTIQTLNPQTNVLEDSPAVLADYRLSGTTTEGQLANGTFDSPFTANIWDEFLLSTGPGANGGVSIQGNGTNDIVVKNIYGEGNKIAKGQQNIFRARPRNYSGAPIPPGNINATFRIANWGSVNGDPNHINFSSSQWAFVVGNSAPGTAPGPVASGDYDPAAAGNQAIPPITAGTDPDSTKNYIDLLVPNMPVVSGQSLHQCIFVTLSGTGINFLTDSAFRNMDFDQVNSVKNYLAQISSVGLKAIFPRPRDYYLAVEKVNMPLHTAPGTNEGTFLENTISKLIEKGGPLAEKLRKVRSMLDGEGDHGSAARLNDLLNGLFDTLSHMKYDDPDRGIAALKNLISRLSRWLAAVKTSDSAAARLAKVFQTFSDWLMASGLDAAAKLLAFINELRQWLSALDDDPASRELLPGVLSALREWAANLTGGAALVRVIEDLQTWLGERPPANLPALLKALSDALAALSRTDPATSTAVGTFADGTAAWLKGLERLGEFIDILSQAGLIESEYDQIFPTMRIHAYHDTGERITGADGKQHIVVREQSSFGIYAYHEGALDGWQTSMQGARRIAENLYLVAVPNNGASQVNVRIQSVEPGEERIPEDKIDLPGPNENCGCLCQILRLFGIGKK